jgi:hypothetical protein
LLCSRSRITRRFRVGAPVLFQYCVATRRSGYWLANMSILFPQGDSCKIGVRANREGKNL